MTDALVSFVIERLGDYLIRQAVFLGGVKKEVAFLQEELKHLHCFINDAQKKQINSDVIRQWVSDIIDIAYQCEDVLDNYMVWIDDEDIPNPNNLNDDQGGSTSQRSQGLSNTFKKFFCICSKTKEQIDLYGIGQEIEAIKERLTEAARRSKDYNLQHISNKTEGESSDLGKLKELRRITSLQLKEINVVGYEDDAATLLTQLLDENKPQRSVISIYGTGGLGKTTLAGKLYHHEKIQRKFNHRAWVSVSQDYDTKDLLQRILYSFNKDGDTTELENMSITGLERHLQRSLKGHSYLLVIDDIWQKEAWKSLKKAFPDDKNGSRVIITTRNQEIAERVDENTFPYALRFLSPEESWQLFCNKAFKNYDSDEILEKLGKKMVEKCRGLPLAIDVLAGLLSTKEPNEWSSVSDHIWKHLTNDSIEISNLLALSFDDLPSELKVCFLYLGQFPEDHEIKVKKIIRLWVSEGLVSQKEETMEDQAEENLNELINRSLIQIGLTNRGRIKTCKVHDLLRDLAIQKAKELKFVCINDGTKIPTESSKSFRRQAFYLGINTDLWLQNCNLLCRSLLFFNQHPLSPVEALSLNVWKKLRVVRVLDLENCKIQESERLPEEIGKLIHLKYLGLRNTSVIHLPPSIGKLSSLQTLNLQSTTAFLPTEIGKLTELRHLIGRLDRNLPIDNLTKLQTLKYVEFSVWNRVNTTKLVNLRQLTIYQYDNAANGMFTFDSIANLKCLRILSIKLSESSIGHFGSLEPVSHCEHLQDLHLEGTIHNLPENLHELMPNLECLSLERSNLKDDPMPKLEKLLKLTRLHLGVDSYVGRKMICSAKGFLRLKILNLCLEFDECEVKEGALPVLRDLKIFRDTELRIPERLRSINILIIGLGDYLYDHRDNQL